MLASSRAAARSTEGATLIVSLLFVMLLLAVIMSVTAQVTLSSRRSSVDQHSLLSARYAAESGVARVQARLTVMKALLEDARMDATVSNSELATEIAALCGIGALPAASPDLKTVCTFGPEGLRTGPDDANPRVSLFLKAVNAQAFGEAGFQNVSDATRSRFWSQMFAGTAGYAYAGAQDQSSASAYTASFGLIPARLDRQANIYRLYFDVPPAASEGRAGPTTQNLSARAAVGGHASYFLLISRDTFAKYALFTNHHFQSAQAEADNDPINFTSRTLFSGPVHTNGQFLFNETPTFWGEVTSAGCPRTQMGTNPVTGEPGCGVDLEPGAFFGANENKFLSQAEMTGVPGSSESSPVWGDNRPVFRSSVKWDARYTRLPTNSQNQQLDAAGFRVNPQTGTLEAAPTGGLLLQGDVQKLQLWRDEIGGQERQRISYTQGDQTVDLSFGADRQLYILNGEDWVPAGRNAAGQLSVLGGDFAISKPFNGVIAVQNGSVADLNGGPNGNRNGKAGASIATFAGVTVAATGNIAITSSLKYTDPPCSGQNTTAAAAPCDNPQAQNILGVYSSGGNIELVSPRSCPDGNDTCPNVGTDPTIHAVLMASQGAVQVRGYDQSPADNSLGSVNLIGGLIENYYGAFGKTDGRGYGRNFVYDQRTYDGYSPPSFPTQEDWTIELRLKNGDQLVSAGLGIRLQGDAVSTGKGGQ
ncbi:DUF4900 domain-containing protein [Deinococcus frigens]|uniref:DUF4900 domain-containing protein n=1 Tax=Deinococcus frigens TaxID=249403 RepID=UPI0012EC97A2|nr:DUF4900 domain-containing protein [Deinococcus frigens]